MNAAIVNDIIDEIKEKKCNFAIRTNIARGRGLNGVTYDSYYGYTTANNEILHTKILDCYGDILVLETDNEKTAFPFVNGGKRKIYLNTDSILSIELIETGTYQDLAMLPAKIDQDW